MPSYLIVTDGVGKFYTVDGLGEIASNGAQILTLPELSFWRDKLLTSRTGLLAPSAAVVFIGDSITEGVASSKYFNRWVDQLRRKLQASGSGAGGVGYIPASSGIFSTVTDGGWVGGDIPWTYTAGVSGAVITGIDWHGASIPVGDTATIHYFGTFSKIVFSTTVGGPTACAVTIDGGSAGTVNARDPSPSDGNVQLFGIATYGFHTVTFTPNDGPLLLEGFIPYDSDFFFNPIGNVVCIGAGHSGGQASQWGASGFGLFPGSDQWVGLLKNEYLANLGLAVIALGVNDENSVTADDFEDDIVGIVNRLDVGLGHSDCSIMFVVLPGIESYSYTLAMANACHRVGAQRATVVDLANLLPNREFGPTLSDGGAPYTHPNDTGATWVADHLISLLDPLPPSAPPVTPAAQNVLATDTPVARVSWASNVQTSGGATFDQSPSGTTQGELRYRVWLDPGTYRATLFYQRDTSLGTIEVLLGRYNAATAELVSVGSVATAGTLANLSQVFGTTVVNSVSGWCSIYVRKTTASGAVRFRQLTIDKIA